MSDVMGLVEREAGVRVWLVGGWVGGGVVVEKNTLRGLWCGLLGLFFSVRGGIRGGGVSRWMRVRGGRSVGGVCRLFVGVGRGVVMAGCAAGGGGGREVPASSGG